MSSVRNPEEAIERYLRVLRVYKKKRILADALEAEYVDGNTIKSTAAIAELSIAAPDRFQILMSRRREGEKLAHFNNICQDEIDENEEIRATVKSLKKDKKLLDFNNKKK